MNSCLYLIVLAGLTPGPIDAFRANYAASKVELAYHYRCGNVGADAILGDRLWSTPSLAMEEQTESEIFGRWSCDGTAEAYEYSAPEAIAERGRRAIAGETGRIKMLYRPSYEGIFDGETLAGHHFNEDLFHKEVVNIGLVKSPPAMISNGCGPFSWWANPPFPWMIQFGFPGIKPTYGQYTRNGYSLDAEVYRQDGGKNFIQLEVSYDRSVSYLPRYARLAVVGDYALVQEFYLVDAKPCNAGGVVPTEWYSTSIRVDRSDFTAADYSFRTILKPLKRSFVGHFLASEFRSRSLPVALTKLETVKMVVAPGGSVKLKNNPRSLTLASMKSDTAAFIKASVESPLPALDLDELNKFENKTRSPAALIVCLVGATIGAGLLFWRRRRPLGFCLLVATQSGCGQVGPPVAKLSATFSDSPKLYDLNTLTVPLNLVIRNDGNVPLRIFKADGGCSCREVERSRFPASLDAGKSMSASVKVIHSRMFDPQAVSFSFETDRGTLTTALPLHVMPRRQLSPENPSAMISEGERDWTIELTDRSVSRRGEPHASATLNVPTEFELISSVVKPGTIAGLNEFSFEDTVYRVRLKDRSLGLRKCEFRLVGQDGNTVATSVASWKRSPFISSIPELLTINERPARAFLRCEDESVEMARIVGQPPGINAIIVAPREISVTLADGVSGSIAGEIEIQTTAESRPSLRIPVVRYAGPLSQTPLGSDKP